LQTTYNLRSTGRGSNPGRHAVQFWASCLHSCLYNKAV